MFASRLRRGVYRWLKYWWPWSFPRARTNRHKQLRSEHDSAEVMQKWLLLKPRAFLCGGGEQVRGVVLYERADVGY
jgi:hypothetical protein